MGFKKVPRTRLPTQYGVFTLFGFQDEESGEEAVALVSGDPGPEATVLTRIHSQCLTGDVFGSQRCDCRDQLHAAMHLVAGSVAGIIVYQQQEGRGIGLINKIHAYELQDRGLDTVSANEKLGFPADQRDYRLPARILKYLGILNIQLLSNNPEKKRGLQNEGISVLEMLPLEISPNSATKEYLETKKKKLGHLLSGV